MARHNNRNRVTRDRSPHGTGGHNGRLVSRYTMSSRNTLVVTTTFASPLGEILLAADGRGLTGLWFEGQEHFGSTLLKEDPEHVEGADGTAQ